MLRAIRRWRRRRAGLVAAQYGNPDPGVPQYASVGRLRASEARVVGDWQQAVVMPRPSRGWRERRSARRIERLEKYHAARTYHPDHRGTAGLM
jgi:hypothetical protein